MPPPVRPPITAIVQRTDLACLQCGRVSGYVQDRVIHVAPDADRALVGRLRCTWCGGRLIGGEMHQKLVTRPLTPAEADERRSRGRPPKRMERRPEAVRTRHRCVDCDAMIDDRARRCDACVRLYRARWPALVTILSDGRPHEAAVLRARLGLGATALRKCIQKARSSGRVIRTRRNGRHGGVYLLEGEAAS